MAAALIGAVALVLGLRSLMENGATIETAPTLSVFILLLTIIAILSLRQNHALDHHFALASGGADRLMLLSQYLSAQILCALLTALVLVRLGVRGPVHRRRRDLARILCPGLPGRSPWR